MISTQTMAERRKKKSKRKLSETSIDMTLPGYLGTPQNYTLTGTNITGFHLRSEMKPLSKRKVAQEIIFCRKNVYTEYPVAISLFKLRGSIISESSSCNSRSNNINCNWNYNKSTSCRTSSGTLFVASGRLILTHRSLKTGTNDGAENKSDSDQDTTANCSAYSFHFDHQQYLQPV